MSLASEGYLPAIGGNSIAGASPTIFAEGTYNEARDWVTEIKHSYDCEPFLKYNLTYDGENNTVGNITGVTELDSSTVTYGYDAIYRLTSEIRTGTNAYTKSYGYDLAGNLLTLDGNTFASYDDANKFSTVAGGSVSYDADGNLTAISETTIPSGSFAWNENDKLTSQTAGSTTTSYGYNAFGKRIWSQVGSGTKTYFVFDGDLLIGEVAGSTPSVAYTWGGGKLVSERLLASSATFHYHFGPQGETRALTNSSGTVSDSYTYTGYGKGIAATGSTSNPFRYGGRVGYYSDGAQGLMLAGARWYTPNITRWLTRDPIEYEGGSNLYAYVNSRPIGFLDPLGLEGDDDSPYLDNPRRRPPNWSPDWRTGRDPTGDPRSYSEGDGKKYRKHPEDDGHWDHYDFGKGKRYPPNSKKPLPGQKKIKPGSGRSFTDPWLEPGMERDCPEASPHWAPPPWWYPGSLKPPLPLTIDPCLIFRGYPGCNHDAS